jgi:hypothetical protein
MQVVCLTSAIKVLLKLKLWRYSSGEAGAHHDPIIRAYEIMMVSAVG